MANTGGVGGSGGGSKTGSAGNTNGTNSAGKGTANSASKDTAGKTTAQNTAAKTNNTDAAKAKTGIDCEATQKADLNQKMDSVKADVKTAEAKTETTKTEDKKAEKTKAELKAEAAAAQKMQKTAKEFMDKAKEFAKTAKKEFDKFVDGVKKEVKLDATRKELDKLSRVPEVKALMDTVGFTEGTGANYGKVVKGTVIGQNLKDMPYDKTLTKGMKNVTTTDLSQHPNVAVKWSSKKKEKPSSAAGKYQFLSGTWQEMKDRLGLKNFHANSQDLAAVQKMKDLGMVDAIMRGDLKAAVNLGSGTWASLPKTDGTGVYTGQNVKAFNDIQNAYDGFLKNAQDQAQAGDYN